MDGEIRKYDEVIIATTRSVRWISTDKGNRLDPHGRWSVVEICSDGTLLLCKDVDLIRIPSVDVRKVGNFDIASLSGMLNNVSGYGRKNRKEEA